jgi:hypothetical protein
MLVANRVLGHLLFQANRLLNHAKFADTQKKRAAQPHAPPNCAHTLTPA